MFVILVLALGRRGPFAICNPCIVKIFFYVYCIAAESCSDLILFPDSKYIIVTAKTVFLFFSSNSTFKTVLYVCIYFYTLST